MNTILRISPDNAMRILIVLSYSTLLGVVVLLQARGILRPQLASRILWAGVALAFLVAISDYDRVFQRLFGSKQSSLYDQKGSVVQQANSEGAVVSYQYDDKAKLIEPSQTKAPSPAEPEGTTVDYRHDIGMTKTVPSGKTVTYRYDGNGDIIEPAGTKGP